MEIEHNRSYLLKGILRLRAEYNESSQSFLLKSYDIGVIAWLLLMVTLFQSQMTFSVKPDGRLIPVFENSFFYNDLAPKHGWIWRRRMEDLQPIVE